MIFAVLAAVAKRAPRLAYGAAHLLSRVTKPQTATRDEFARLFPRLTERQIQRAMRDSWSSLVRSAVMKELVQRYGAANARDSVLPNPALAELRAPAILAVFHLGPLRALTAPLEAMSAETIIVRGSELPHPPRNTTTAITGDTAESRASAFHFAARGLREGKFALLTVEPDRGTEIEVTLFGRPFTFGRGVFALARMSRAPIVPLAARWHGSRIEIVMGEAIEASDDEAASAQKIADWLERYLTEHPHELKPRLMELFRR